ncbi:hypothetical protein AVEN_90958-1 [Araneus ventricosus]|uniref:Uncharacterized protein n=1 Tax=Araneus ventricosus TaxID=182803 RepID=A0A4Y2H0E5_ARAVE|nr:hypothetical protein AVEN_90958-1 [Araneus ventricosus]
MGVTWGDIWAVRRMLQDLPSKFFKELEGLLATCGLSLSWRSTIQLESLAVRLFLMVWLFMDYVMHSFFAYRQFNSNFTCGDSTILPCELIHSRNRGSVGP